MTFVYLLFTFIPPALVLWSMVLVGISTDLLKIWLVMQTWQAVFMLAVSMNQDGDEF